MKTKKKVPMSPKHRVRRQGALDRLMSQLKTGIKNTRKGPVDLSEKDIKRINREIETLKTRV